MEATRKRLEQFLLKSPRLGTGVYIAPTATVLGDVTLGDRASVWFGAVLRGDINRIEIGEGSNVQDNAVVHLADDYPALIGRFATVGHSAIIHACTIGNECLIGMGATILDGVTIGDQCLIGAHALLTPGTRIPPGSMVLGAPGKVVRELSTAERSGLKHWADKYVTNAGFYLEHGIGAGIASPLESKARTPMHLPLP